MKIYIKPRLKPSVEFCSIEDKIYFFNRPSIAVKMNDETNFIKTVCKTMDGKLNFADLTEKLTPLFPLQTPHFHKLLQLLDKEYLLQDEAHNYPHNLSEYDINRWSRNIDFFGNFCEADENKYAHQEKLKTVKITILGLGGVGSNILYNLVAMGICNIKVVDFDKVELSNLNRQIIYDEADIGQLKSESAKKRINNFISNANIQFINKQISSAKDIEEIIFDQDIVINAIDHPREKIINWLNLACVNLNIPFLCGSLDSRVITYFSILPKVTGCVECWKSTTNASSILFLDMIQHAGFVAGTSTNIAIMPFISLLSGFVSNEVLKMVTKISEPHSLGKLCVYDFLTSQITISESWEKNLDCLVCSKN